jgi:cellulose biosynthesis protein BcsQ
MENNKYNNQLNWFLNKYKLKNINELINFADDIAKENKKLKETINILENKIIYNNEKINYARQNRVFKNKVISKCPIYIYDDGTNLKNIYNTELNEILNNNNNIEIDEYIDNIIEKKGLKNGDSTIY